MEDGTGVCAGTVRSTSGSRCVTLNRHTAGMPTRRTFLATLGNAGAAGLVAACAPRGSTPRPRPAPGPGAGMVASSQRHASEAGVRILRAGGNAADAAVATAAALAVTEPTSTGIGGDCFALYYDAHTRQITALNGSGRAPAALTLERLRSEGMTEPPLTHGHAVTVPGACAGWCDLARRHGTRPLATLFAPAIELAEDGFAVAPVTAYFWGRARDRLHTAPGGSQLLIDGRAPNPGERFRNPGMARTLRLVASDGADAFYRGPIARDIVDVVGRAGGAMSLQDLAAHTSTWDEAISVLYRGYRIWECPPNGQGITALVALNILSGLDLRGQDPLGADRQHLLVEAMRLAFADTRWYVADPAVTAVPIAELLSESYAKQRRALIDPKRAQADVVRGSPVGKSETVYFCVVDGAGNACSFINSNYTGVGTGMAPAGWGFPLHNRGLNFHFEPDRPNSLAPHKRPYHTIIPGLITHEDGSLLGPFGVMGGFMQPQGHVQVVVGLLDDGLEAQAVIDRPRFCIEPVDSGGEVHLEEGYPATTAEALAGLGHPVKPGITGYARSLFGRGQVIIVDGDRRTGGSDRRADGVALAT
jgi:gamma-glutamyltranspeptidase/glutathione hydrolase